MTVPGNVHVLMLGGEQGYKIERSLRFNSADSAYLNKTIGAGGTNTKHVTSFWMKRSNVNTGSYSVIYGALIDANNYIYIYLSSGDKLSLYWVNSSVNVLNLQSTLVLRDPSAWYHIYYAQDTDQATAANRFRMWVNGVEITSWSTNTNTTTQSVGTPFGGNNTHQIGRDPSTSSAYFNGYITEFHDIWQPATLPPVTDFGETDTISGVWKPKKYAGTYGTNGFYLNFSDNSGTTSTTLGKDSSGNGNNWTPNNFSVTAGAGNDSLIDTPTPYADGGNGRGNYCTWNPLAKTVTTGTWANGNLEFTTASGNGAHGYGTFAIPSSGKWYWEVVCTSGTNPMIGICQYSATQTNAWQNTNSVFYYVNGQKYVDGSNSAYGSAYTTQTIGVAVNADAGTITFYRDNVSQGSITHAVVGLFPCVDDGASATADTFVANFGQRPFAYTPPSGFVALNTQNLPEPSIKKPNQWFDVVTRNGFGSSGGSITSLQFQPDFLWNKTRNLANSHNLIDAVRGVSVGLKSDSTAAEASLTNFLTSFNSNGYTIGTADFGTTTTLVDWCWKESATPGFDIVTYTGDGVTSRTVSHSLGVTPAFIVIKQRNSISDWETWHKSLGSGLGLRLNTTSAQITLSSTSGGGISSSPTSSVFSFTSGTAGVNNVNANTATYVAYLWSEVAGFSKFGSYTGNGSADGPFCFCGFRPAFIMIKRTDTTGNWTIHDNRRLGYNGTSASKELYPNLSLSEGTDSMDQLSNGFKLRDSYSDVNASSGTYVFAAFSESAFKYALAR